MKPVSVIISARCSVERLKRPSTRCWMPKRIGFAVRGVTNAAKAGRIPGPERSLHTVAGEVNLKVPKLRRQTFETAIIERYRRRESSVEEALIEMYLAGISVRRVEDITEALWGTRVDAR